MRILIDAAKAATEIEKAIPYFDNGDTRHGLLIARDILLKQPHADALPVVRCKDCWKDGTYECAMHCERDWSIMPSWNEPDDFCSWGERKGEK